jgi:transcriptional regulator with XRE-family HTH domain
VGDRNRDRMKQRPRLFIGVIRLRRILRKRRIEKNMTREQVAEAAGVAVSNIVRFEQKGLISLKNLIGIAMALGYISELKHIFALPKYSTMEELTQIRKNQNKKKAHRT